MAWGVVESKTIQEGIELVILASKLLVRKPLEVKSGALAKVPQS